LDWEIDGHHDEEISRRTELVLHKGVDINAQDEMGETALHIAMRKSSDHLVMLLVKSGADLTLADKQGRTAFEIAAWHSRSESIVMLLLGEAGVKSSLHDRHHDGEEPLRKRLKVGV
jgi:ankyrin repeat protein